MLKKILLVAVAGASLAAFAVSPVMAKPGGIKVDSDVGEARCDDPKKEDNVVFSDNAGVWWVQQKGPKAVGSIDRAININYEDDTGICIFRVHFYSCGDNKWYYAPFDECVEEIGVGGLNDQCDTTLGEALTRKNGITKATLLETNSSCWASDKSISSDSYLTEE